MNVQYGDEKKFEQSRFCLVCMLIFIDKNSPLKFLYKLKMYEVQLSQIYCKKCLSYFNSSLFYTQEKRFLKKGNPEKPSHNLNDDRDENIKKGCLSHVVGIERTLK